ncbi:MAG: methyltransferase domain-containing protein [candidate division Zixibacteria bacterium]|nr:methyltransferase domain-containing protein [candidate division Zixibacteria bacterium]
MPKSEPFDKYSSEYDSWFEENRMAYESELKAVKHFLPESGDGIEIGVGTGRFAGPLGIKHGLEPSANMRAIAKERGIDVVDGIAEKLPFDDNQFDYVLMVTVVCFLDDVRAAFTEANRILKNGGVIIIALIDRESPLGQMYEKHKSKNEFYKHASFYSAEEIKNLLTESGFKNPQFIQTIFNNPSEISKLEDMKPGYGTGGFVVVRTIK